jgi:hypothetical protein
MIRGHIPVAVTWEPAALAGFFAAFQEKRKKLQRGCLLLKRPAVCKVKIA